MSHRTHDLPPVGTIWGAIRNLRYHEISRQLLAVVLILLYALTSRPNPSFAYIGIGLAILGTMVRLHASGFVLKNKELATDGPYALMRHPLYTGNILLITGFALAGSLWWGIPLALVFFWFYYPPAIEYEDRKLHGIFEEQWEKWSRQTPALLPNFSNIRKLFSGSWSFMKSTKQNGEVFIALYVVACMAIVALRMP
jgi:protein-S-isoprenylcysteine O-methyltransferase Ste14